MIVTLLEECFRPVRAENKMKTECSTNLVIMPVDIMQDEEQAENYTRAYRQAQSEAEAKGEIWDGDAFARQYREELNNESNIHN